MEQQPDLLTSNEVAKLMRCSCDWFRRKIQHQPDFPKPFKAHPTSHPKWYKSDIEAFVAKKALKLAA